ncbi:hypothetical protein [Paraburkholderia solisilvae]|uniref:Uncharacterized protein n=1 Tax=Paraburkholderia solisilvae TaxID=624376 RepID=A0A6J5ETU2_9BURK|nr:hypothetical protein [Paraburkholderia solisilvae]CAB3769989.1 hypothetical protein LMG29739_05672 [Paraburkholderia solisilvae]
MNNSVNTNSQLNLNVGLTADSVPEQIINFLAMPNFPESTATVAESLVIFPDGLGAGSNISYETEVFSSPNLKGTLLDFIKNFTDGTSQDFTVVDDGTENSITNTYSLSNLHGTLTSSQINLTNGTSEQIDYTNLPPGILDEEFFYSDANDKGAEIEKDEHLANGDSQINFLAGPNSKIPAGLSSFEENFNAMQEPISLRTVASNTGDITLESFSYDGNGNLLSEHETVYDSKGNVLSSQTFDGSHAQSGDSRQVMQLGAAMAAFNPPVTGGAPTFHEPLATTHAVLAARA